MNARNTLHGSWLLVLPMGAVLAGLIIESTTAYPRYRQNEQGGYCATCHGSFTDGTSPAGTVFPSNNKHEMHAGTDQMETNCNLCHDFTVDLGNPFTNASLGTANNPGVGCIGCHGHDYGGMVGVSGAGLRLHHEAHGVFECLGCHPVDPVPLPENVMPIYYGTVDTLVDDPCNAAPGLLENWSVGDVRGLDNDGDDAYDADDADCPGCPHDLDGDGSVSTLDLLVLLAAWGDDPGGPPDFDGDGNVGTTDLLGLLANWGQCP